jgi:hypothetical protein
MTFRIADKAWIAKIEKETGGLVDIKPYFGETLSSGQDERGYNNYYV